MPRRWRWRGHSPETGTGKVTSEGVSLPDTARHSDGCTWRLALQAHPDLDLGLWQRTEQTALCRALRQAVQFDF